MCHRVEYVRYEELVAALELRATTGRATVPFGEGPAPEAYPGASVPLLLPAGSHAGAGADAATGAGAGAGADRRAGLDAARDALPGAGLDVVSLTWGFPRPQDGRLVFNTRLDTALAHLRRGEGLWAEAFACGRCLVPLRAFFETSRSTRRRDPQTGRETFAQFRFAMPGHAVFLVAGIAQDGRFSLVTTEPNAVVGEVHTRMPLVLAPGESAAWLAGDVGRLADRSAIPLTREEAV